ncbi:hypothetical protein KBP30_28925 [Streptomyces sp. Go40/10]|uniref:hypothetical protein n=1 Tax=Streptomyces sp. Go40/10 TaxID=2825844 RepID=UPI001E3EB07C|nr:hypothetical protein [Streptomyces sp. Go40/10]UFR04937.1 hypothetical protein KBP30_28925 [Streptomyces sp. Go40/10]
MDTERPDRPEGADPQSTTAHPGRTSGRRPTAVVVAVATAAVLLVGGGGAYLAASGGPDGRSGTPAAPGGAGRTPPPLTLDGWTSSGTGGVAPGEPDPHGTRYVARGELPEGPGSAPVYEPRAEVGRERVVRLAKALGIDGAPVAEGRIWRVGGQDGSGPVLRVNRDAPGSWSFDRYAPGTDDCRKVTVCAHDPGAPAGDPVSVADAEKAAAPVLKAAGLDDAKTDASQVMGARRVVNADPVVGGLPTYGWTTGLTVDRTGELVGGHGLLATPVKGDTYPVLDAGKTLELLNGPAKDGHRMGIGGCATPVPLKNRLEQPCGASTGAPGKPSAKRDTNPDTNTVTVEKAVFGLAAHSVGGRQTLVPSWLFRVRGSAADGAFTVTYPAVDPEYLTSRTASAPSAPSSAPSSAPPSAGEPAGSRSVRVNAYTADGRTLNLSFYGGVCADYRTSARESGGRVTVTVTEKPWPGRVCVLIAKEYVKTVTLHAPLDGRTVVDADGRAVPKAKPGSLRPDASARPR